MEQLLHYVWRHRLFPLRPLYTTDGRALEVVDPGLPNTDAGPDFFNAKVRVDGTLWVGNVEVHERASDWLRHGHDRDRAYDNVVLHVVGDADAEVCRTDGHPVPQLLLPCPDEVRCHYDELRQSDVFPPCRAVLTSLPLLKVHAWLSALLAERLRRKADAIGVRLRQNGNHWEDAFFVTLARNFGFGLNADAFEAWALRLPLRDVAKHRDSLFQIEALFFGLAGLLDDEPACVADEYPASLLREYRYLQHKFTLPASLPRDRWRFLRLRPSGFPHVRLAQLAAIYRQQEGLLSRAMESATLDEARRLFVAETSPYWNTHYRFGAPSACCPKRLGAGAVDLIVLNTVIPFLYAYGQHRSDENLCARAARFLEELRAEDNSIIRQWAAAGLPVRTAADSQALLQLKAAYCDRHDCLRCRFGYEYLKRK